MGLCLFMKEFVLFVNKSSLEVAMNQCIVLNSQDNDTPYWHLFIVVHHVITRFCFPYFLHFPNPVNVEKIIAKIKF